MNNALLVLIVLYLIGIFGLSIYASRRIKNEEDYVVAGRRLPLWLAWGTLLATWFGAATILGSAEAARAEGVRGTLLDPFASGVALILAGLFFAKPLWEMKLLTIGDFYARTYGPRAEILASVVLVPGYFGWLGAQFVALGELQETFFHVPLTVGILLGALLIVAYTMIGGMWSVTLTDTLQLVVLLIGVLVLGATVFSHLGDGSAAAGLSRLWRETSPHHLSFLPEAGAVAGLAWVATLGSGFFGNIPGQDLMQRVFASKDSRTASLACILAGVVYLSFGLIPVAMGLASRLLIPEEIEGTILTLLASQFLSPTIQAVFVLSLVSIIVSTATSATLAPATILAHNLLGRIERFKRHPLFWERVSVGLMTVGGVAMAFSGETILGLLETTLSVILVGLFVPLLMGVYGKPRGELSALLSIGCGAIVWLLRELMEGLLLPISQISEMAGYSYPEYISHAFPSSEITLVGSALFYSFALIPSSLSGVAASLGGYFAGQAWLKRHERSN